MKVDFNEIPKFVINLERRLDRLEKIKKEMSYIDWDFTLFKAIDTNSHVGCTKSHIEIIKTAKENKYESVLIIEDDSTFMPYAKDLINVIESTYDNIDYSIINLSPTLNRPVNKSENYPLFLDITNLPKKEEHHRGIFATNMILYHNSIYDNVLLMENPNNLNYYAIDDFIYRFVTSVKQSYSPILPLATQISDWSDISGRVYNNFHAQTYNWNLYSPIKIPNEFLDNDVNQTTKSKNIHKNFYYEG